jgi:enoyl-CoA hydratase/carnithine racemase
VPLEIIARPRWTELVLNQPPRNVLDREMLTALVAALDEMAAKEAPLLLIKANGKHFSTGYSINDIPEEIFHSDPGVRAADPFEQLMDRLTHYPAPIVAAVQGDAYGGAVELLACCDLRVAAQGMRLGVPPVRLGLVYSHTGLRRMIRGFGSPLVREMLMTGEAVDADRAYHVGFFNRLVPAAHLEETAVQFMRDDNRGHTIFFLCLANECVDSCRGYRIKAGGWFVVQHNFRLIGHGTRQCRALFHATR